jgi:putative ATPase
MLELETPPPQRPLADRMRPRALDEMVGQPHLLGPGKPLRLAVTARALHSMILWGPPGSGKTTLARLLAQGRGARFLTLSAVLAGVKDIRAAVGEARQAASGGQATLLFVDEVHRFNKAQQDAFLPHVESGLVTLVGATTENPGFELNNALLSRARTYVLKPLDAQSIAVLLERALADRERGLGELALQLPEAARDLIARAADGDARRALNFLEQAADLAEGEGGRRVIAETAVRELVAGGVRRFDKGGDLFYDQISALHKAVRGSAPDAALYWLARMLDGGCDPVYILRRVVRMATEDIGNADPRALRIALDAWEGYTRLGSPEGDLGIAQAVVYLACAAKSNAVYTAFAAARDDAARYGSLEVPMHLRNAPTRLARQQGHGEGYRYAHNEPEAYAAGERYFPQGMPEARYYRPVDRGLEIRIGEKLAHLRDLDERAGRNWDRQAGGPS